MEEDLWVSPATTGHFAEEQADELLRQLALQVGLAIESPGADEVHDLRVSIRRLICALVVFKPCFPRKDSRRIRRALKKIMALAASVRDRDIALRLLAKLVPSAPNSLIRLLQTEREEAAKILVVCLERWVRRNLSDQWHSSLDGEGLAEDFRADPVAVTATRMLPRMVREYFRCGKDATHKKSSAEELHRFRLAAKNLRYTLDLFAPLYGTSVDDLLQQLKGVQALLGEINDCATVRRMVPRHKGGRRILAALKRRQRRKVEQFRQQCTTEFSNADAVRQWTDKLRQVRYEARVARKPPARVAPAAPEAGRSASA